METTTPITPGYRLGFTSLDEEVTVAQLEVGGQDPVLAERFSAALEHGEV